MDPPPLTRYPSQLTHAHVEPLAMEIHGLLERIVEDRHTYLIIDLPQWHRYVQFITQHGDWLRGETVGNEYLDIEASLTEDDDRLLMDLGWNPVEPREEACGNY